MKKTFEPKQLPDVIVPQMKGGARKTLVRIDIVAEKLGFSKRAVRKLWNRNTDHLGKFYHGRLYVFPEGIARAKLGKALDKAYAVSQSQP